MGATLLMIVNDGVKVLPEGDDMGFQVSQNIDEESIACLLSSAFEGGSNGWYMIEGYEDPENPRGILFEDQVFKHTDYPVTGGAVIVSDQYDESRGHMRLDGEAIQRGLKVMQDKYPRHWGDFLSEDGDAVTGDVFLQCCLFGEAVYG